MKKYYKNTLSSSLKQSLPKKAFWFEEQQIQKLKTGAQVVLALSAVAGVVAVGLIAPKALSMFKLIPALRKSLRQKNRPAEKIIKTFYYLKQRGYVKLIKKDNEVFVELTEAGKKRILQMNFENPAVHKTEKWDNKWWFVLADIPTKEYRNQADSLRRKIRRLGLYPLQRTVWVYPYNPTESIAFVAGRLQIDRFVTILRADVVEEDDKKVLLDFFKAKGIL